MSAEDDGKKQRNKSQHRKEDVKEREGRVSFRKERMVNISQGHRESHCLGSEANRRVTAV